MSCHCIHFSAGRYRSSQQLQSEQEEKRRIELPSKQRPTTSMLKDEISKTQSKVVILKKEETSLSTESESSADSESGSNEDDSDDDSDSGTVVLNCHHHLLFRTRCLKQGFVIS